MSGDFLRRVGPTGWTSDVLLAPWGGEGRSHEPVGRRSRRAAASLRAGAVAAVRSAAAPQAARRRRAFAPRWRATRCCRRAGSVPCARAADRRSRSASRVGLWLPRRARRRGGSRRRRSWRCTRAAIAINLRARPARHRLRLRRAGAATDRCSAALVVAQRRAARARRWLSGAAGGGAPARPGSTRVTIAAGVAALALLYAAVDGLLANAPRLDGCWRARCVRRAAAVAGAHA